MPFWKKISFFRNEPPASSYLSKSCRREKETIIENDCLFISKNDYLSYAKEIFHTIFFSLFIKIIIFFVVIIFILINISDYIIFDLPAPKTLEDPREQTTIFIRSHTGKPIASRGSYFGGSVSLQEVSPYLIQAIIALEDRHFFYHIGFDPIGIIRALWKNMRSGYIVQGYQH